MNELTNIQDEADRYQKIKEYLRELYRGNLTCSELIMTVCLIENPGINQRELKNRLPLIGQATFYKNTKKMKEKGLLPPLNRKKDKLISSKDYYTYLLGDGELFKIGKTINVENRLNTIHSANPRVRLITYTTRDIERELLDLYSDSKFQREWFRFSSMELIGVISNFHNYKQGREKLPLQPTEEEIKQINSKIETK